MESRKIIKSSEVSCGRLGTQAAHTQNREQGGGLNLRISLCYCLEKLRLMML